MFISIFKDEFDEFIKYKRSMGYQYAKSTINCYARLDKFFYDNKLIKKEINKDLYDKWLTQNNCDISNNYLAIKYSIIKQFCSFLIENSYENIYYSDEYNIKYKKEFIPHIYTDNEIRRIFNLLPNFEFVFEIITKLLYSTGLRISETLDIELSNVDLNNNKLTVINSKNNVSRIILLSDSMNNLLKEYINSKTYFDTKYLFSNNGKKYSYQRFRCFYCKILNDLDIKARIHDLRHTFAVNSLNQMVEKGYDIYTSLPILSRYMGHKDIKSTEYYLRFIEKYYDDITNSLMNYYGNIYPILEVMYE